MGPGASWATETSQRPEAGRKHPAALFPSWPQLGLDGALGPCRRPRAACVTGAALSAGGTKPPGVPSPTGVGLSCTNTSHGGGAYLGRDDDLCHDDDVSADAKPAEAGPTCKVPARCLFAQLTSPRVGVSSFTSASAVRAQIVVQRVTSARLLLDNVSECKELLSALPLR